MSNDDDTDLPNVSDGKSFEQSLLEAAGNADDLGTAHLVQWRDSKG